MKSDSIKSIFAVTNPNLSKEFSKANNKEITNPKPYSHKNANNLSFDTSLIKCFCKKDTPELDKSFSTMEKEKNTQNFLAKNRNAVFSADLYKDPNKIEKNLKSVLNLKLNLKKPNEEQKLVTDENLNKKPVNKVQKYDGSVLIMNVNDLEIYNDVTENDGNSKHSNTPNPWAITPFSTSLNTPFTTPRLEEGTNNNSNNLTIAQKKYAHTSTQSKNFKNLSFVSNDSTNYDSENLTLNSYRLNTQINNLPEPNINASVFLNQSLNISGNISSRRNTYENVKNQEYCNFLNEWKNLHYYHKNTNIPENNGDCLNIVPEEINEDNMKFFSQYESNNQMIFNKTFLQYPMETAYDTQKKMENNQEIYERNRNDTLKSNIENKRNNVNVKKNPKKHYNFDSDEKDFEIELDKFDPRTTIMIKNIPNKYTKMMIMEEINLKYREQYDFFYLPIDFTNRCNVGYAFINFIEPKFIKMFYIEFNGKRWKKFNSEKICVLKYARIQGKNALIQHFQNSSVMRQPDTKLKPVILAKEVLNNIQQLVEKQFFTKPYPPSMKPANSIFNIDEQEEELIPKNAKISKNIGRDTPTAVGPKSFGKSPKLGFTANPNSWGFNSRQHHLHRPIEKYFSDKEEEQLKKEEEEKLEKIKEKSLEDNKLNELMKIKELIKAEKNKIKLCLLCKRKFANAMHIANHEKLSEFHKANLMKKKQKI